MTGGVYDWGVRSKGGHLSRLTLNEKLSCWLFTGPAAWSLGTFTRTLCPSPPSLRGGHARRAVASWARLPKRDMSM